MKIELAGFNVEAEILEKLNTDNSEILTPEVFSSAYARISRSAKDIAALRSQARKDIDRARKSNQTIIFDMGHHSVAEHAVFNFDIIGVSRLALEEIEQFRLASYTEKSQRYVTLEGDYVLPEEITDGESKKMFRQTIAMQNEFYKKSFAVLRDDRFETFPERFKNKAQRRTLENLAKEDARYILSLASEGQVGLTINARNLEHLFRRFHMSRRAEVRAIGQQMFDRVNRVAPSLILFPQPSDFEKKLNDSFKDHFTLVSCQPLIDGKPNEGNRKDCPYTGRSRMSVGAGLAPAQRTSARRLKRDMTLERPAQPQPIDTTIIDHSPNADDTILAAFLARFRSLDWQNAHEIIAHMDASKKENLYKEMFERMEFFDAPPREFELAHITFQAVISASNFAQLKRHRMATLIWSEYDTAFGNTVPESIVKNGLADEFNAIIEATNCTYEKLKARYGPAADYILTNSHRRMVIMKMNLRELYHFVRLRDDEHAQWDIRELAANILHQTKAVIPYSTMLLCGKSDFITQYEKIYHKPPKITAW